MIRVNIDAIAAPYYNYGGLSPGNLASICHKNKISHPKKAALQGLEKMRVMHELGVIQLIAPPLHAPNLTIVKQLGLESFEEAPEILRALLSSANLFLANSATFTPSVDSADGRAHLTVANRRHFFHRAIEAEAHLRYFQMLFEGADSVRIHPPLPFFKDEGAANHVRLSASEDKKGSNLFIYGGRQSLEASQAVARLHQLDPARTLFIPQNPQLIEEGIFHNDLICFGQSNHLILHEAAFCDPRGLIQTLTKQIPNLTVDLIHTLSIKDSVKSYFFNSELLHTPSGKKVLLMPYECQGIELPDLGVDQTIFLDLSEAMHLGGGPACLRLALMMTSKEVQEIKPSLIFTPSLYEKLKEWIHKHYIEELDPRELLSPIFLKSCALAINDLENILMIKT